MKLDPKITQGLVLVKYLFQQAVNQAILSKPNRYIAILSLHNAIDLFLDIAINSLGIKMKEAKHDFLLNKFNKVSKTLARQSLTGIDGIKKLNKAQNSLRHEALFPNDTDFESYFKFSMDFLKSNTPIIFGIDLSEITLVESIKDEKLRAILKEAIAKFEVDDHKKALEYTAVGFEWILKTHEANIEGEYGFSPYRIGSNITYNGFDEEVSGVISEINCSLERAEQILLILCLGIDFHQYIKYSFIVPRKVLIGHVDAPKSVQGIKYDPQWYSGQKYKKEDVDFCITFVINTAIKLQGFDYSLPYSWIDSLLSAFGIRKTKL